MQNIDEEIERVKSYIDLLESNGEYLCADVFRIDLETLIERKANGKNRDSKTNGN